MRIIRQLSSILDKGSERSTKVKRNIIAMLFVRGGSILIGFLLLPLTLHYVDKETYGIWLTLSSMVAWVSFFDIGLNNGLKNKLTESIAKNDRVLSKKYVSTTYAVLVLIFMPLMAILLIAAQYLNWNKLLNINVNSYNLKISVCIIIAYFCFQFVLNTINVVLYAHQRPAAASLRSFIQQLITIVVIYFLTRTTNGSLINLCLGLCFSPLVVVVFYNFTLFRGQYKDISPSIQYVDFTKVPDLMKLGMQFFIIQIASIIQFQLVNFLIIRNFGADNVTNYNIAYKYFSILTMIWGIFITPLWAAVTDALARNDYLWVKNAEKKYLRMFFAFLILGAFMLFVSSLVYDIWIGEHAHISFALSFWVLIYNLVSMFGSTFVYILNGAGELKIQTIASIISPFIFLVVTHILISMNVGVYAIIIGSILSNFNGLILAPIQCYKLLNSNCKK